jgi:hypothetical protein
MVPALDSQSGLFARLTPCLRGVSGVKKANMDARLEAPEATVMTQKTNTIRKDA